MRQPLLHVLVLVCPVDVLVLVCPVVVHDDVQVLAGVGDGDVFEEFQELLIGVPAVIKHKLVGLFTSLCKEGGAPPWACQLFRVRSGEALLVR